VGCTQTTTGRGHDPAYWQSACAAKNKTIWILKASNAAMESDIQRLRERVQRLEEINEKYEVRISREAAEYAQVAAVRYLHRVRQGSDGIACIVGEEAAVDAQGPVGGGE
jgi:Xaa-Pro aminopeptidase